jgi:hypothetical protein
LQQEDLERLINLLGQPIAGGEINLGQADINAPLDEKRSVLREISLRLPRDMATAERRIEAFLNVPAFPGDRPSAGGASAGT